MEVIAVLYMQDWHICVPADFSLGFEGDNNAVTLEISTDLPDGWDLKVDVAKDGEKNIIQLNRRANVYYALLTSSMLADDGVYEMQVRGTLGDQVRHSNIFLSHVHNSNNSCTQIIFGARKVQIRQFGKRTVNHIYHSCEWIFTGSTTSARPKRIIPKSYCGSICSIHWVGGLWSWF